MTPDFNRYHNLLSAIDAERKHERTYFSNINNSKTTQQKIEEGFCWYPIQILRKSYTIGEYVEVEVQKTKSDLIRHRFSNGAAVSIFNNQDTKTEFKGVLSFIRADKMRILLNIDHIDQIDVLEKGLTGVEIVYDDKPYKVMETAIKNVMKSKEETIMQIRSALEKGVFDQFDVREINDHGLYEQSQLNQSQKDAISRSLLAPYLSIIHGPPGTGKTTTLVSLVHQLLKSEKRVLVCASSNNAVDLLAHRLSQKNISVLRLGNITRIDDDLTHLTIEEKVRNHPEWNHIKKVKVQAQEKEKLASQFKRNFGSQEYQERKENKKEARELRKWALELEDRLIEDILLSSQVIATTLVGVSHRNLDKISFETVVIDEASQALEAECWNAILKAKRVILAGDHKQLPPTVKSKEALALRLDNTILDILSDTSSHSSLLTEQYRMNDLILGFSNEMYYQNKLQSHESVRNRFLRNDPYAVVFIDTAGCGFEEVRNDQHRSYANHGEYFIIREHIINQYEKLAGCSIGIISPYAEQVRYIQQEISTDDRLKVLDIDVNSIDGFQGQEKEVIYISLVRANENNEIGFLKDDRRLNVALTRAQKKLVIVGDSATIGQHVLYISLLEYIEQNGHYDSAWNYMGY